MNRFGYIEPVIEPDHYVLGALALPTILPGGQWDTFLPPDELQNRSYETYCCTTEGTHNAIETLIRQEYSDTPDYSDRWVAAMTGTGAKLGNDPHAIAEFIRKSGTVPESAYPFDAPDFQAFYQNPPKPLSTFALEFPAEYDFGHQWLLNPTQQQMMDALEKSPLGVAVYAWQQDPQTGYFIRPKGAADCHWTLCYGYERNSYWKVFDSYDNTHKKLAWDFDFYTTKQYTLHKQLADTAAAKTAWQRFLDLMQGIIDALS